jgi:glycosyltransferase involved in cell wall biosynthesis
MEYLGTAKKNSMITPVVSVCVQTYRHARFISECLDNIIHQQTSFPFEIIIGEDESTDGTREICMEYANKFPDKIRLFLRSRKDVIYIDGSATGRFNFVENLKATRGKYIALCEGDDFWNDPKKLQKQFDFMETHPEYSVCFHQANLLKTNMEISEVSYLKNDATLDFTNFIEKNFVATASHFFRQFDSPLPKWFINIPAGDWALILINAQRGKMYYMKEAMATYRHHSGGTWTKLSNYDKIRKNIKVLEMLNDASGHTYQDEYKKVISRLNNKLVLIERNKTGLTAFKIWLKRIVDNLKSRD